MATLHMSHFSSNESEVRVIRSRLHPSQMSEFESFFFRPGSSNKERFDGLQAEIRGVAEWFARFSLSISASNLTSILSSISASWTTPKLDERRKRGGDETGNRLPSFPFLVSVVPC